MDLFSLTEQMAVLFGYILARIGGLFAVAPIFGATGVPVQLKLWLSMFVAFIFFPQVSVQTPPLMLEPVVIALTFLKESLIGLLMGFTGLLIFAIIQFAAIELDNIMGLMMSATINPISRIQASITGQLFYMVSIFIFLGMNGHHWFISSLSKSYSVVPIGHFGFSGATLGQLSGIFSKIFLVGFEIALPIFSVLFIINVVLGVLARMIPQLNVFFISFPVKINVGLTMLFLFFPAYILIFPRILAGLKSELSILLQSLS